MGIRPPPGGRLGVTPGYRFHIFNKPVVVTSSGNRARMGQWKCGMKWKGERGGPQNVDLGESSLGGDTTGTTNPGLGFTW